MVVLMLISIRVFPARYRSTKTETSKTPGIRGVLVLIFRPSTLCPSGRGPHGRGDLDRGDYGRGPRAGGRGSRAGAGEVELHLVVLMLIVVVLTTTIMERAATWPW